MAALPPGIELQFSAHSLKLIHCKLYAIMFKLFHMI